MRRTILLTLWLLSDFALFIAAYVIAYFLRVGFLLSTDFPLDLYVRTVVIIAPLWLLVMGQLGIFRLTRVQSDKKNLSHILFACVMATALFTLAYYFLHNNFFSRLLLVYAGVLSLLLTTLWHLAYDQWQRQQLRKDPPAYPVLVIGINRETERIITLLEEKQSPLKPIGVLDAQGSPLKEIHGVPVLGKLNVLEEVIKTKRPTHLLQCSNLEHTINLISVSRQHRLTYMLLPSVFGAVGGQGEVIMVEGQPMLTTRE